MTQIKKSNAAKSAQQPQEGKTTLPLGKTNFILMAVCGLLIVLGFALMCGDSNTGSTFNEHIFDARRTVVAPLLCFVGFVLMAFAIIVKFDGKKNDSGKGEQL